MGVKKKSLLFLLYSVSIISVVVLFIIFRPLLLSEQDVNLGQSSENQQDKDSDKNNNSDDIENDNPKDEEDENNNPEDNENGNNNNEDDKDKITPKLVLNLDKDITISVGEKIEFCSNYIIVEPIEKLSEIEISVVPRYSSSANGIIFENNCVTGVSVGSYKLVFKLKISETKEITDQMLIWVKEEKEVVHLRLLCNEMTLGDELEFNKVFEIADYDKIKIETNENLTYSTSFKAVFVGIGVVKAIIEKGLILYTYEFQILVKQNPEFSIYIEELIGDEIIVETTKNKMHYLTFIVKNGEEEMVDQRVRVELSNYEIAEVFTVEAPLIFVKCINFGSVQITLIYEPDDLIFKTFTLVFVEKNPAN